MQEPYSKLQSLQLVTTFFIEILCCNDEDNVTF